VDLGDVDCHEAGAARSCAWQAAALPAVSRTAAPTYPARAVRLIVGFAAGGGGDIVAPLIGQHVSERLGKPFVVENRTGAVSNIAVETVISAQSFLV
jgi:tripartite-type tricarboxylate transporter receptor subunit TctC